MLPKSGSLFSDRIMLQENPRESGPIGTDCSAEAN